MKVQLVFFTVQCTQAHWVTIYRTLLQTLAATEMPTIIIFPSQGSLIRTSPQKLDLVYYCHFPKSMVSDPRHHPSPGLWRCADNIPLTWGDDNNRLNQVFPTYHQSSFYQLNLKLYCSGQKMAFSLNFNIGILMGNSFIRVGKSLQFLWGPFTGQGVTLEYNISGWFQR